MLRTAQRRHPGRLVSHQPDSIWAVSTVKGRDGPLPSGLPSGKEMAGTRSSMNCLYSFTDPNDRTGCCGDDLSAVFPPLPQQVSLIPFCAGARIRGIKLGPLRWEQKGRTSHSPDYNVLGRSLGQVTHGPPGLSIRPENALGRDVVSVGRRVGPRSKRAAPQPASAWQLAKARWLGHVLLQKARDRPGP